MRAQFKLPPLTHDIHCAGMNLAQVSFGCTSPALTSTVDYPLFVRTVSSEIIKLPALARLFNQLEWRRCSLVKSDADLYNTIQEKWTPIAQDASITIEQPVTTFIQSSTGSGFDFDWQAEQISGALKFVTRSGLLKLMDFIAATSVAPFLVSPPAERTCVQVCE